MKNRIAITVMIASAMLAACGNTADSGNTLRDKYDDTDDVVSEQDDDTGKDEIDTTIGNVVSEPDNTGSNDAPVEPESKFKEVFYDECNGARTLEWLDESELPGSIDYFIESIKDDGQSVKFDYRDISDQEVKLIDTIDTGIAYYQIPDAKVDKECFRSAEKSDPKGQFDTYGYYFSADKKAEDMYFCKVFNCAQEDLDAINEKWNNDGSFVYSKIQADDLRYDPASGSSKSFSYRAIPYSDNGKYYYYDVDSWAADAGAQGRTSYLGTIDQIESVAFDGVYYYISYVEYDAADYLMNNENLFGLDGIKHSAVLQWKEDGGEKYWSLFFLDAGHMPAREISLDGEKGDYARFFYDNYSDKDIVFLADVTHDGTDDMIVINQIGFEDYSGHVYTLSSGDIKEIYTKTGGLSHAGGIFNWYVIERDNGWNLAEEYFGMWQGMGNVAFDEYYLSEYGEVKPVTGITCPADDTEVDSEGFIIEAALDRYNDKLIKRKKDYYVLFAVGETNSKQAITDPAEVFR